MWDCLDILRGEGDQSLQMIGDDSELFHTDGINKG